MSAAPRDLDCLKCGACCHQGYDVLLSPSEEAQYQRTPRLRRLVVLHTLSNGQNLPFLRQHPFTGRCVALRGRLGDVYCSIHPDRPSLCDMFEVGSEDCLKARRDWGVDPPIS